MDMAKQVEYWTTGSKEDLDAARMLLKSDHPAACIVLRASRD
jgi:hypothetical protein